METGMNTLQFIYLVFLTSFWHNSQLYHIADHESLLNLNETFWDLKVKFCSQHLWDSDRREGGRIYKKHGVFKI